MSSSMIQIRNVPVELHRRLKARAALAGQSLSDYLLQEIQRSAAVPTREEVLDRLRRLPRIEVDETGAAAVAAGRRERDEQLASVVEDPAQRSRRARR